MPADSPSRTPDAKLLSQHVAGDREAFSTLVTRHQERLWAVALRTLGDEEEAADALQDALISAFRKAGAFRGDAAVTTWLHRIVVNACLDRVRRRAARPAIPASDTIESLAPGTPDPTAEWEQAQDVTTALGRLPSEQRAALVLVDMEGYSVDESAEILGVAPGTVKSRCARGRARLAPLLTGAGEQPRTDLPGNHPATGHVSFRQDANEGGESGS